MTKLIALFLLVFSSNMILGDILLVRTIDLNDISFSEEATEKCSDGKHYITRVTLKSGDVITEKNCHHYSFLRDALEDVFKGYEIKKCVIRETCEGSKCTKFYGRQRVDALMKVSLDEDGFVNHFARISQVEKCTL